MDEHAVGDPSGRPGDAGDTSSISGLSFELAAERAERLLAGTESERLDGISQLRRIAEAELAAGDTALRGFSLLQATLRAQFDSSGARAWLDEAVDFAHPTDTMLKSNPSMFAEVSSARGAALVRRSQAGGAGADLAEGVAALRAAGDVPGLESAALARVRVNLAVALQVQFSRTNSLSILDEAVESARAAMSGVGTPTEIPARATLSGLLFLRFQRSGVDDDLAESIAVGRSAVVAAERSGAVNPSHVSNLAAALGVRFRRQSDIADLDESIELAQQSIANLAEDDFERPRFLSRLSIALQDRFEYTGATESLDEAIRTARQAVSTALDHDPQLAMYVANLSTMLQQRFERVGSLSDIDDAVAAAERAATLGAPGDRWTPGYHSTYAKALRLRFERTGDRHDIDAAVMHGHEAIERSPQELPSLPGYLTNLEIALLVRYEKYDDSADLDHAIDAARRSVELTPAGHPLLVPRLSNLCNAVRNRYDRLGRLEDISEAIEAGLRSVTILEESRSGGNEHPDLAAIRSNLGVAFDSRFASTQSSEDARRAIDMCRAAANSPVAAPAVRLGAALRWARVAVRSGDAAIAHLGYRTALRLLTRVALRGLERADGEHHVGRWSGLASEAAAHAISIGEVDSAMEMLEQGRAILWSQLLVDHDLLTELRAVDAVSASELEAQLDILDGAVHAAGHRSPIDVEAADRVSAVMRVDAVLAEIRARVPGFESFMETPRIEDLRAAAGDGTVVVVNIAAARCDALIVDRAGVRSIPLTTLTSGDVDEWVGRYLSALTAYEEADKSAHSASIQPGHQPGLVERHRLSRATAALHATVAGIETALAEVCGSLWDHIAAPVLDTLGSTGNVPSDKDLPRIWWCPTGKLGLLPLHAAGHYDGPLSPGQCVMDHVVSSYTPTLRALHEHADDHRASPVDTSARLLVVSVADRPDSDHLAAAVREDELLRTHFADRCDVLADDKATVSAVLAALPHHRWVHFSCHGEQDLTNPASGGVELFDGRLSISALSGPQYRGEFAYLSACKTATGGTTLTDEVVTTAAALHYRGYRQVVGTLWSVRDDVAAEMAADVYSALWESGEFAPSVAAYAVRSAVRSARTRHPGQLRAWVPFIHLGP